MVDGSIGALHLLPARDHTCSPPIPTAGDPPEVVLLFEAAVAYGVVPLSSALASLDSAMSAPSFLEQLYIAIRLVEGPSAQPRPPAIAVACGELFSAPPEVRPRNKLQKSLAPSFLRRTWPHSLPHQTHRTHRAPPRPPYIRCSIT